MSGIEIALAIAGITLGPGSLAALAVKLTLNGARKDIRETRSDVAEIKGDVKSLGNRVSKVEIEQAYQRGRRDTEARSK